MENNVALSIKGLNKFYGKRQILHDINMECYCGEVFGFLGPNGAGKTTTIKIVVGLLDKDNGEIAVCGDDIEKNFENAMANVGGIVENPEMYKYMSGKDNLLQYARMRNITDINRVDEVVKLVGLSNRINEKVSKYSLGMRQRLGVAQALLHKPKLMILDEPTNGLDPEGIKDLRDVLKHIAHNEGVCVVVSSHLMAEMEMLCDRVGIIANGSMIGTYTLDELTSSTSNAFAEYEIEVDNSARAVSVIRLSGENKTVDEETGLVICKVDTDNEKEIIAQVNKDICDNGIKLYSVHRRSSKRLEDVFIELTHDKEGDGQIG